MEMTTLEGLALDNKNRAPLEGVKIRVFVYSAEQDCQLVFETATDNNGYFSGSFQAGEDTLVLSPFKEEYTYSGSYTIEAGVGPLGCEKVKSGKKQFYTLVLNEGSRRRVPFKSPAKISIRNYAYAFIRRIAFLPILKNIFPK
jgi:hypothetical protein